MFAYSERISTWANELRENEAWSSALNDCFDSVGFDQAYLDSLPSLVRDYGKIKLLKDRVWGMVELWPADLWLVDCPILQRSRRITQTGLTFFTYPNAHHNRFEHSLGVYAVAKRLFESFRRTVASSKIEAQSAPGYELHIKPTEYEPQGRDERLLLHAALLHDIGHAIFSHASERVFSTYQEILRIGPMTVKQFRDSFRKIYDLADSEVQTGKKKPLAELLAVAIITSARFEHFYKNRPGTAPTDNSYRDLCDISALILGDRISSNDFALPELLSGPVDSDKLDYMLRDASACGINIGIDVSRAFVRAGVYEGTKDYLGPLRLRGYDPSEKIKIFVIEQSGTDAVRELGAARLSLYERVYFHQVTRNAEAVFSSLIVNAAAHGDDRISRYGNYLFLWSISENGALDDLAGCDAPHVSGPAWDLRTRRLPKRASVFGLDFIAPAESPAEVAKGPLQDAHELRLQGLTDGLFSKLDGPIGSDLLAKIRDEAIVIRDQLRKAKPAGIELPNDQPGILRLLPFPTAHDATPPPGLVIRGDRVEEFGERDSFYRYAGEAPSRLGYLVVSEGWREIASLAFQSVLYREYQEDYSALVGKSEPAAIKHAEYDLDGLFRPVLEVRKSARKCKLRLDDHQSMQEALVHAGYYDRFPVLYPHRPDEKLEKVASRFVEFAGQGDWRVRLSDVSAFVSQFPPGLRGEMVDTLRDSHRFLFLNRKETVDLVIAALGRLGITVPCHLVPLTPSSGQNIRTHIRSELAPGGRVTVHAELSTAISAAHDSGGSIVLIDDNIASGTQATEQLRIFMGVSDREPGGNYHLAKLDERQREMLKEVELGAAFAVGHEDGCRALSEEAGKLGLNLTMERISFGRDLETASGKRSVSPGLREFLAEVGRDVLRRRFEREGRTDPDGDAETHALGYAGMEGLLATSFSVPTSTYAALWCPGITGRIRSPWTPLFLRTEMLQHLVLP